MKAVLAQIRSYHAVNQRVNVQHTCSSPNLWVGTHSELLTLPSRGVAVLGYSCHSVREIHTSSDCAPPSPLRQAWRLKHRNVFLGVCSGAEQMQFAKTWRARPLKNVLLSEGAPTQVVSALKIAHGFVWAHNSHAGKLFVKFLELHCATFTQVKEEKSA